MRVFPARAASRSLTRNGIIGPWSEEFSCCGYVRTTQAGNTAWNSANDPLGLPFHLNHAVTVRKLGWINGTSPSTNFDMGIYTTAWARVVSTGSTARSGATTWQWVDIADTVLSAGSYYLVGVNDAATASQMNGYVLASADVGKLVGGQDSTTDAFPLPDPLTNMVAQATLTRIPAMAMAVSGTVV